MVNELIVSAILLTPYVNRDEPRVSGANEFAGARVIATNPTVRDATVSAATGAAGYGAGKFFGGGFSGAVAGAVAGGVVKSCSNNGSKNGK